MAGQQGGGRVARLLRWLASGWLRRGWLVPLQGLAMVAHLAPGGPGLRPPAPVRAVGAAALLAGAGLATASALTLGPELTPAVDPRPGAGLRTGGVYGLSRNPLYAGLLVASAGTVLLRGRAVTVLASAGLAAVLHVKAGQEERMLLRRFGAAYEEYRARVPRTLGLPRG